MSLIFHSTVALLKTKSHAIVHQKRDNGDKKSFAREQQYSHLHCEYCHSGIGAVCGGCGVSLFCGVAASVIRAHTLWRESLNLGCVRCVND